MGTRCADHVTPLYPQKLALTSPTDGGRSVGIVRVRTKATEFSFSLEDSYKETQHCVILPIILNIKVIYNESPHDLSD